MPTRRSMFVDFILYVAMFAFLAGLGTAQTEPDFNSGLTPYQGFHGGDLDSINMATGSLNLHIPLISVPQRGSALKLAFSLNYNSTAVKRVLTGNAQTGGYQWTFVEPNPPSVNVIDDQAYTLTQAHVCFIKPCSQPLATVHRYYYSLVGRDGAQHLMGYTSGNPIQVSAGTQTLRSLDGTGLYLNVQYGKPSIFNESTLIGFSFYDPSGIQYSGTQTNSTLGTRQDSNGNLVTVASSGYTDTMGRSIPFPPPSHGYKNIVGNTDTTGCTGPSPTLAANLWTVPGYNNTNYPIKFCYAYLHIDIPEDGLEGPNGQPDGISGEFSVLQSIVLPDPQTLSFASSNATSWTFEYNDQDSGGQYGSLTKVTLPTGGSISYTYALLGDQEHRQRAVTSRTVNDGSGSKTWTYTYVLSDLSIPTSTIVTNPLEPYDSQPNETVHTLSGRADFEDGFETQVDYYQGSHSSGTLLKTVSKNFTYYGNPYYSTYVPGPGYGPARAGMFPVSVTTTLPGVQPSQVQYTYDSGFSIYDMNGSLWSSTFPYGSQIQAKYLDYGSPGASLKTEQTTYQWQANSNYLSSNLLNLKNKVVTLDGSGTKVAETDYTYDAPSRLVPSGINTQHTTPAAGTVRGNPSTVVGWLNTGGTNPTTSYNYYDTGEIYQSIDPMLNTTTYSYSSNYVGAYVTQTQMPDTSSPALAHHIVSGTYDFNTGLLTNYLDQNNQSTTISYDNARRITSGVFPAGGGQKTFTYTDTPGSLQVVAQQQQTSTTSLQKTVRFDELGRSVQTQIADPEEDDYTETVYDSAGHAYRATNPHRSGSSSTDGYVQKQYDGLGRVTVTTEQDGSTITTTYSGNCVTVTDEAGRTRKSCSDALGRMTQVFEDPAGLNYETDYKYDALGNLTCVEQHGGVSGTGCSSASSNDATSAWRVRRFTYDSLSRLLTATNPETSTLQYGYNAAGDLTSKTDARGVTVNYTVDALHRATSKTYSNGDPSVTYSYDSATGGNFGNGRRTGMTDASGYTSWIYDPMGRATSETKTINGISKAFSTSYNLDGSPDTITYPTGSIIAYGYDSAGHVVSVTDTVNQVAYVSSALYTPPGALAMGVYGSVAQTEIYNKRLQPCWTYVGFSTPLNPGTQCNGTADTADLLDLKYDFGSNNNGNLLGITNSTNTDLSKNFTYDSLNRVKSYQTTTSNLWGVDYTIDAWGNLTNKSPRTDFGGELMSIPATLKNQLLGLGYDAGGNMVNDGRFSYTYNAENQIAITSSGVSFVYDGDGERVQKSDGTTYWGGGSGGALLESDNSGTPKAEYIYFNGKRIARRDLPGGDVKLYFADNIGSASVISNFDGELLEEYDYGPFGELHWQASTTPKVCYNSQGQVVRCPLQVGGTSMMAPGDSNHYMFTGKERDSETGLDYFGARYYENNFGRWLSPDWAAKPTTVPYASFGDPQTLNLYGYIANRPVNAIDADGHQDKGLGEKAVSESALPVISRVAPVNDRGPQTPMAQQQNASLPGTQPQTTQTQQAQPTAGGLPGTQQSPQPSTASSAPGSLAPVVAGAGFAPGANGAATAEKAAAEAFGKTTETVGPKLVPSTTNIAEKSLQKAAQESIEHAPTLNKVLYKVLQLASGVADAATERMGIFFVPGLTNRNSQETVGHGPI